MTIVDSLKAKGSTGGNNIAEAIKNLPMGGGDGSLFVAKIVGDVTGDLSHTYLDKTYAEIEGAFKAGKTIVVTYGFSKLEDGGESETEYNASGFEAYVIFFKHMNKDGTVFPGGYTVRVNISNVGSVLYKADSETGVLLYEYDG